MPLYRHLPFSFYDVIRTMFREGKTRIYDQTFGEIIINITRIPAENMVTMETLIPKNGDILLGYRASGNCRVGAHISTTPKSAFTERPINILLEPGQFEFATGDGHAIPIDSLGFSYLNMRLNPENVGRFDAIDFIYCSINPTEIDVLTAALEELTI
jgi:hypothetical protein